MKILAVRGANLASLAGEFSIEFDSPPLADAGIFAITGKTGSGKSTLLDAISLALYNRIPRTSKVEQIKQEEVGDPLQLSAHDVRTILRTGTAEGYAEVDFITRDKKKYRARWQVRRARRKASGKLQKVEISLMDLADGSLMGGKLKETLKEIQDLVGLDFEQFSRTVLLSQGEFDAFLKAKESERSLLLEALTGTAIYSQISRSVHHWAREKNSILTQIKTQLGEHSPLTAQERKDAELEAATLTSKVESIKKILDRINQSQEWYKQQNLLSEKVAKAKADLAMAQNAEEKSQPQREQLALVIKARTLLPEYQELLRTTKQHGELQSTLVKQINETHKSAKQLKKREVESQQSVKQLEQSREALAQAQEDLKQAADLESRIQSEETIKSAAQKIELTDRNRVLMLQDGQKKLEGERDIINKKNQEQTLWLQENSTFAILESRFDEIEQDIWFFYNSSMEIQTLDKIIAGANSDVESGQKKLELLTKEQEKILAAIKQDEEKQRPLLERMAKAPNILALQKTQLENRNQSQILSQLLTLIEQAKKVQEQIEQHQTQRQDCEQEIGQCIELEKTLSQKLEKTTIQLEEARRAERLAQATAGESAAQLRALLVDDAACPVCGATEHPIEKKSDQFTQRADSQAERVTELVEQEKQIRQQKEELIKKSQKNQSEKQHHQDSIALRLEEKKNLQKLWVESTDLLPKPDLPKEPMLGDKPAIQSSLTQLQTQLQAGEEQVKKSYTDQEENNRLEHDLTQNRLLANRMEKDFITGQAQVASRQQAALAADSSTKIHQKTLEQKGQHLEQHQILEPTWKKTILSQPDQIITDCRQKRKRWSATRETMGLAEDSLIKNRAALQTIKEEHLAAHEAHQRSKTGADMSKKKLLLLQKQRSGLFNGKNSQLVRAEFEAAINSAATNQQQAFASQAEARSDMARLGALKAELEHRCTQADMEQSAALENLDEKCQTNNISANELPGWLSWSQEKINNEQHQLNAIQASVIEKNHGLTHQKQSQADHKGKNQPALGLDILTRCWSQQQAALQTQEEQLAVARSRIHSDNLVKKRAATLLGKLEKQQSQTDIWDKMNHLVGSNSGDKFRKFAQSITLDRLIEQANLHLTELTPRYSLQRAVQGDLSLQVVDLEMGGEVRGIANLSGGERFLTSLAMALGLAGMSSNRGIQVESLFIDEGFGALDETSLNMAISALEALHSTGRVVGIISHVPALTERIGVQVQVQPQGGGASRIKVLVF
jgi:DNA repair protein SbcC/Rad50